MMLTRRSLCTLLLALTSPVVLQAGKPPPPPPTSPAERPQSKSTEAFRKQWQNAGTEALTEALNRLAHESIAQAHEAETEERRLRDAWRDPAHQTQEIVALRERLRQLEADLLATRTALHEAVEAIPEIKVRREALQARQAGIQAVIQERETVQALLREREAANKP